MSDTTLAFGFVDELYLMGATPKTIAKMTKLPIDEVERIIYQIEKNRKILVEQNKEE